MPEVWRTSVLNRERFFLLQKLEQPAEIYWVSWSPPSKNGPKSDRSICAGEPGLASRTGARLAVVKVMVWAAEDAVPARVPVSCSPLFWGCHGQQQMSIYRVRSKSHVLCLSPKKNTNVSDFERVEHFILLETALRVPGNTFNFFKQNSGDWIVFLIDWMKRYLKNRIVREVCEIYSQICAVPVLYTIIQKVADIFQ